jgi:outer membrane protein, multidrug efflux system
MTNSIWRKMRPICVSAALLGTLAGCAKETPYAAPSFAFQQAYSGHKVGAPVLLENTSWWKGFKDPTLDRLVERALRDNLSLAAAKERIVEAEANLDTIPGGVSLNPSLGVRRSKGLGGTPQTRSEASVGLSWLLDPYGARRQQGKAARARIEVADAETDAAQLLVLLNLTNAYVDLRYSQQVLRIRHQEIRSRRQTLELTQTLFDKSSATRLDLVRAEARLSEAEAAVPTARAAILRQQYQIAGLLGVAPGTLDISLDDGMMPHPAMSANVGIPADILRNRPDVRIAERIYYANVAEIGVAKAQLYPQLSLSGAITLASVASGVGGGVHGAEYFFGPSLTLPSLPGGPRKGALAAQESRARQAHTAWQSTVLDAIREVETAIVDYSAAASATGASQKTVRLYREAASLTRDLVLRDSATLADLLDAEESITTAELTLAQNQRQQSLGFINLNVSLGSGHASERVSGQNVAPVSY